ncbi:GntR family transcriptional regulator [Actinomadura algeriensis]|uniref:DNA-binding GntR family transcriptional regulator n=1 Tax=Actinomadura algeriensis TaxID=1679523 RepID=A0ABR9JRF0_9ACTN|nr:GntR family transcriptional regulator [Actinomadura algeriensis]MBE1533152.1 DNA-binding GntR family transcriptional regulator [Actinomadura algeriensis]
MNEPHAALPTAQQHAVGALRRLIVSGELRPGQRVNQEDIAARVGLSVAPVREALRVLAQEGQLTYRPRRGYFVTELQFEDLSEIYQLRRILEARAARHALPKLDDAALRRIGEAARTCAAAAAAGDVAAELAANRTFHFAIIEAPGQPHVLRLIRLLWESTEVYRAMYYNLPEERAASVDAHDRIIEAIHARDADRLVRELDDHRNRALDVLRARFAHVPGPCPGDEPVTR